MFRVSRRAMISKGGKGRAGGAGQQGRFSTSCTCRGERRASESEGQVRANDKSYLVQCHSRHVTYWYTLFSAARAHALSCGSGEGRRRMCSASCARGGERTASKSK